MKLTADRPFADPEKAARRLMDHARAFEPVQDGRIYIEKINGPFLFGTRAHRQSIGRGSTAPLRWAGWRSTGAALSSASRKAARTCSRDCLGRFLGGYDGRGGSNAGCIRKQIPAR
jgi:hypothetical protein